ncbi:MAG: ribosome small subunit-dependent GTPase A [Lachnospiraceae bacterium]|nr:ribosome small subunit-dependent GTPase A [Lachnospiraceae bacterium]
MNGKIIKGIAGFYYVDVVESGIYECKAKGIFRKKGQKPLVGDEVRIQVLDEETKTANIVELLPRKNELIRPAVANIDQAIVIFALKDPEPNRALLDRFLVMMEHVGVPVTICFNKCDLGHEEDLEYWRRVYEHTGYSVLFCTALEEEGTERIRTLLEGKTTVVAGPSGVGKSTITNLMQTEIRMETGEISRKLQRGKHTTRHSQLIPISEGTYLVDTPGFTSLYTADMEKEQLKYCFPEFAEYEGECRFQGCVHVSEPGCAVKAALREGRISQERYENYQMFYEELREKRRY